MCVRIVSPAQNARVWYVGWEKVTEPVHVVRSRPCLVSMSVQAVHRDDAVRECEKGRNGVVGRHTQLLDRLLPQPLPGLVGMDRWRGLLVARSLHAVRRSAQPSCGGDLRELYLLAVRS